jgi:hypothetical protein
MTAYRLLKPGGILWLETPNIDSVGHCRWGKHWRGLEPPRHLVLFNYRSLRTLLSQVGFQQVETKVGCGVYASLAAQSEAIQKGRDPYKYADPRLNHRIDAAYASIRTFFRPEKREFISLTCQKATDIDREALA